MISTPLFLFAPCPPCTHPPSTLHPTHAPYPRTHRTERAQLARRRTATLVGQALLRLQLKTDHRLTTQDIDATVAAIRYLQVRYRVAPGAVDSSRNQHTC